VATPPAILAILDELTRRRLFHVCSLLSHDAFPRDLRQSAFDAIGTIITMSPDHEVLSVAGWLGVVVVTCLDRLQAALNQATDASANADQDRVLEVARVIPVLGADVEALVLDLLTESTVACADVGRCCWRRWRALRLSAHVLVGNGGRSNSATTKLHQLLDQLQAQAADPASTEPFPAAFIISMVEKLVLLGDKATTVRCVSQLLTELLLDHPPPGDDYDYGNGVNDGGGSGEDTLQLAYLNAAVALVNGGSTHREPGAIDEEEGLKDLLLKLLEIPELADNADGHTLPDSTVSEGLLSLALRRKALQLLCATRQGLDALGQRLCLGPGSQLMLQMMEDSHGPLKLAPDADTDLKRKLERHLTLNCHDVAVIALVQGRDTAEADLNAAKSSALAIAQKCVEELDNARGMGMGSLALAYAGAVYRAKRMIKTLSEDMLTSATEEDDEGGREAALDAGGDQELSNVFVPPVVKVLLKVDTSAVHYLLKLLYAVLGSDSFGRILFTHAVWLRHLAIHAAEGFGRKQVNNLWDSFVEGERKAGDEAQIANALPMAFTERDGGKEPPKRLVPLVRTFDTARLAIFKGSVSQAQRRDASNSLEIANPTAHKEEMEVFNKRVMLPLKAIGLKARTDPEVVSVLLHIAAGLRFDFDGTFAHAVQNRQVIEYCTEVFAKEIEGQQSQRVALAALRWVGQPGLDLILREEADSIKPHAKPNWTEEKLIKPYRKPTDTGAADGSEGQSEAGNDTSSTTAPRGAFTFVPRSTELPKPPRSIRMNRSARNLNPLSNKQRWPLEGSIKVTNLGAQRLAGELYTTRTTYHPHRRAHHPHHPP
jgi:hypothetical protein